MFQQESVPVKATTSTLKEDTPTEEVVVTESVVKQNDTAATNEDGKKHYFILQQSLTCLPSCYRESHCNHLQRETMICPVKNLKCKRDD